VAQDTVASICNRLGFEFVMIDLLAWVKEKYREGGEDYIAWTFDGLAEVLANYQKRGKE
jgi:hypothetical protein